MWEGGKREEGREEGGEWEERNKKKKREEEERGGGREGGRDKFYISLWLPTCKLHFAFNLHPPSLPTTYLQDGEVFKHTIHHVSFREVLQTMDETDHVVTHRRTVNTINKPTIVKSCIFSLEKRKNNP